jgi:hypothetical protein
MEPTPINEAKRPRGFWRRNWVALSFAILCCSSAIVRCAIWFNDGITGISVGCGGGYFGLYLVDSALPNDAVFELTNFEWGGPPYCLKTNGYLELRVPFWLVLPMPFLFIALREWRRKRAAKGSMSPR